MLSTLILGFSPLRAPSPRMSPVMPHSMEFGRPRAGPLRKPALTGGPVIRASQCNGLPKTSTHAPAPSLSAIYFFCNRRLLLRSEDLSTVSAERMSAPQPAMSASESVPGRWSPRTISRPGNSSNRSLTSNSLSWLSLAHPHSPINSKSCRSWLKAMDPIPRVRSVSPLLPSRSLWVN